MRGVPQPHQRRCLPGAAQTRSSPRGGRACSSCASSRRHRRSRRCAGRAAVASERQIKPLPPLHERVLAYRGMTPLLPGRLSRSTRDDHPVPSRAITPGTRSAWSRSRERHSAPSRARAVEAIAPDRRRVPPGTRLLSARRDPAHGRGGTIALGLRGGQRHRKSNREAMAVGVEQHYYRSAGTNQPSAAPSETAAGVAKRSSRSEPSGDRIGPVHTLTFAEMEQAPDPPPARKQPGRSQRAGGSVCPIAVRGLSHFAIDLVAGSG